MQTLRVIGWIVCCLAAASCAETAGRDDCAPIRYRVTEVDFIGDASPAFVGFDLDGDSTIDNALGIGLAVLTTHWPSFNIAAHSRQALARTPWLVEIAACDGGTQVGLGSDRAHDRPPALGLPATGQVRATDGIAEIPLGALADLMSIDTDAAWLEADRFTVRAQPTAADLRATVGLALPPAEVVRVLGPRLAAFFDARHQTAPTAFTRALDANADGRIETDEFVTYPLIVAFLAADLAPAEPRLSFGMQLRAVRVP